MTAARNDVAPPDNASGRHTTDVDPTPEREPVTMTPAAMTPAAIASVAIGEPGRAAAAVTAQPDLAIPFRPDTVLDGVEIRDEAGVPRVVVRAASVRGLSHRYYGKTRQDEFAFSVAGEGRYLVAAVADGVSAGSLSHIAADVVTRSGCVRIARQLRAADPGGLDWTEVLHGLADEVVDRGRRSLRGLRGAEARAVAEHMAATALFAVVDLAPHDDGAMAVHVMAFGDTSAWLLSPDAPAPWTPLHEVQNAGAYVASSATFAVPLVPDRAPPPTEARLAPGDALMLMSDGVGDPLGGGTGEVGTVLAAAWRRPPEPLTFAAQVGFARRSYDDDRTVVAVWPVAGEP